MEKLKKIRGYVLAGLLGMIAAAVLPLVINFLHTLVDTIAQASTAAAQGNQSAALILLGGFTAGIALKVLSERNSA
jgi:hypothetical protein